MELAERFPTAPDRIVLSSFLRTQLTAKPLMQRFPHVPADQLPLHEFTFLDPVRWAGTTLSDRLDAVREYWERHDADFCDGPEAESFSEFYQRVLAGLESLRNSSEAFTAVFTHGYVIKVILWHLQSLEVDPLTTEGMRHFRAFMERTTIDNVSSHLIKIEGGVMKLDLLGRTPETANVS